MRIAALTSLIAFAALAPAAHARPLPSPTVNHGPNCHAMARATGQDTVYVGTVLGGRNTAHRWGDGTFRDYRTTQGCFATLDSCSAFVARHSARYPEAPGYARCTAVFMGPYPKGQMRAAIVTTKY